MILITTVSKSVSRETKRQLSNTVAALMPWPRDNQSATEQLMELLILEIERRKALCEQEIPISSQTEAPV
jgi:hypothetical protein